MSYFLKGLEDRWTDQNKISKKGEMKNEIRFKSRDKRYFQKK